MILVKDSNIFQKVKRFLQTQGMRNKFLCLGYSGGVDSTALLYILLECQKKIPFSLLLAHVSHGWRPEGEEETKKIVELCKDKKIPLFLHSMHIDYSLPNLEDRCRQERLQFFYALYKNKSFELLLLAHQADDQAETVLKRILEGASLAKIGGLKEYSFYKEMPIGRPLLTIAKQSLYSYLLRCGIQPFEDKTNIDPRFLRGRMRKDLFPIVEKIFQKNIRGNLCKLALYSKEVEEYLQRKIENFFLQLTVKEDIIRFDLSSFLHLEKIEVEFFIRKICDVMDQMLSFDQIQQFVNSILSGSYNKAFFSKDFVFQVHGKMIKIKNREKLQCNPLIMKNIGSKLQKMCELKDKFSTLC